MFSSKENDKDEVTAHFLSLSLFCNDFIFYFYMRKWQLNSQSEEPLSVAAKLPASFNAWPEWSTPRSEYFEDGSLFHILGDITWRTQLAEHDLPGDEVVAVWAELMYLAIYQVLGYLRGLTSPSLTTEDLTMQLYTSTSFLLLAMSLLVTGSTYLGESIICSLHSPIMYYDVTACSHAWITWCSRWYLNGCWTPIATSMPPTQWTTHLTKHRRTQLSTLCMVCVRFIILGQQVISGLGEVNPTSGLTFHR